MSHEYCVELVPIFNHLPKESMALISKVAQHRTYKKDEYLFRADESGEALYIVHSGEVRLFHLTHEGDEQLLRVLYPGDFTGEWSLFNTVQDDETFAQVTMDSEICVIPVDKFQEMLLDYPQVALKLLEEMSRRLSQSQEQTIHIANRPIAKRLAWYLTSEIGPDRSTAKVHLPLSRKDLATYLGTTPESITRAFKQLEERGLIDQLSSDVIVVPVVDELRFYI